MQNRQNYKWLFLDLNSYFASVEQQDRPELRGQPVAVIPARTESTCAIAASYEAKAYGIKTGTKIYEARKLCPALRCVLARHDLYVEYHHRILAEVTKHVPIKKVWSIDELSSCLSPRRRTHEKAVQIAKQIKSGLRNNVGEAIQCSIGIATNSFLAKVATDMEKPDGLTVLEKDTMADHLFALQLTDLPGINVNMKRRLDSAGIYTVEDLWHTSPKHARHVWGSVGGERFWYNLHGYEIPDLKTKTTTIGHSRVLDPALRSPEAARAVARRLLVKAAARLRRKEFYATRLALSVRTIDYTKWSEERRLSPSRDNFSFLQALDILWAAMIRDITPRHLKKVAVTLYGLCRQDEITSDLFDIATTQKQAVQKNEALSRVMDRINQKYGAESIHLGVTPQTRSGYVGTKIAFSRIPDKNEFSE